MGEILLGEGGMKSKLSLFLPIWATNFQALFLAMLVAALAAIVGRFPSYRFSFNLKTSARSL